MEIASICASVHVIGSSYNLCCMCACAGWQIVLADMANNTGVTSSSAVGFRFHVEQPASILLADVMVSGAGYQNDRYVPQFKLRADQYLDNIQCLSSREGGEGSRSAWCDGRSTR